MFQKGFVFVLVAAVLFYWNAKSVSALGDAVKNGKDLLRGPFEISDGMTFYLVNPEGRAFTAEIRWQDPLRRKFPHPLQIRVFDPEEHLILRHEFPGDIVPEGDVPWEEVKLQVPARGSGIYQVIVNGYGGQVELETDPSLKFGVFGHILWLCGRGEQFAETYVYLPPSLPVWQVTCRGEMQSVTLHDEQEQERLQLSGKNPEGEVHSPSAGEHVWRLSVRSAGDYKLDFGGAPVILCPDPDTARSIRASVDVLPDGTICFHRFQVQAQQILERYRQLPPSAYEVPIPVLEDYREQWLKEPVRNQLLLGYYGVYANLPVILKEQNLDPESPWFGSIRDWRDAKGDPRPGNPFADYERLGLGSLAKLVKVLAAIYDLNEPFNPLYKHPALLNRIIIASLQNLMVLKEGEYATPKNVYYYGFHAFNLSQQQTGAFPLAIQDCPEDVKQVWTEGLGRLVDRLSISDVSTVNQWTVMMVGIAHFYIGTKDEHYADVLRRHIQFMINCSQWNMGQREAGYMTESGGPDATYNGITCHNLAWIYHELQDPDLLESLRRCYFLFNHTIAPEPDGSWLGASSFCHRTPGDWTGPQYGAGFSMMGDILPEAGIRAGQAWVYPKPFANDEERRGAEADLLKMLRYLPDDHFDREPANVGRAGGAYDIYFPAYDYFASKPLSGKLPMEAETQFTRNFGNEFFCVRRPAYYAVVYAGSPMGEWQRPREPREPDGQYPRTGGLCLFWSSDLGTSLLGKNWSTYAAHTLVAVQLNGSVEWEDYWSIRNEFQPEPAVLNVSGSLRNLPISFHRRYEFMDDRVVGSVTLKTQEAVGLTSLSECFPYPLSKTDSLQVDLLNSEGTTDNGEATHAILFHSNSAEAHLLVFDAPRHCDVGVSESVDHYENEHRYGRVLTELTHQWETGREETSRWCILPVKMEKAPQAVRDVIRSLRDAE